MTKSAITVCSLALAVWVWLTPASPAQEAPVGPAAQSAITEVIRAQLAAFSEDDGAEAFSYASPMIRSMFGDAQTFMRMVRTSYQPVYRPQSVEFRNLVTQQGRLVQRVMLVGPDGRPVIANYFMTEQDDGRWLIDGCVLEALPGVAT